MKISIITATYNSGKTVRDTIESVLSQTYPDIEHIIVDGNSKDDTVDIIKEYEPRYHGRLKWISEPDKGIYDAMNKGIAMATGDVVGILNSDDFYTSADVVTNLVDAFSNDIDAVYGDIHFVDDNDLDTCTRYYSSKHFSRFKMLMGYQPAHPSFYCRRDVYRRYGAFDTSFRIAADFEQMFRAIYIHGIPTRYVPMDFVTMRSGGASTSGLQSYKRIYKDHLRAYRKNGIRAGVLLDWLRYPAKAVGVMWQKLVGMPQPAHQVAVHPIRIHD